VHREQGLIVAPGNPLGVNGIKGLPRLRYVNRQRGAGTRVLLDYLLSGLGASAEDVSGYVREEYTHLAVAAAVASGRADTGLGILAAARAFGLDFVPVAWEPYDLVLTERPEVLSPLLELLGDEGFRREVESLGGYDASEMGRSVREG
jgi:putative molybdopterin biosynthesis protein